MHPRIPVEDAAMAIPSAASQPSSSSSTSYNPWHTLYRVSLLHSLILTCNHPPLETRPTPAKVTSDAFRRWWRWSTCWRMCARQCTGPAAPSLVEDVVTTVHSKSSSMYTCCQNGTKDLPRYSLNDASRTNRCRNKR